MLAIQKYLSVLLLTFQSVHGRGNRQKRDDPSPIDYSSLNSQIDAFSSSLDGAYPTFDYNSAASVVNGFGDDLTSYGISITPLPNYSSFTATAQPEPTPAAPHLYVSDVIKSQSEYLATRSPKQAGSVTQAGSTSLAPTISPSSPATSASVDVTAIFSPTPTDVIQSATPVVASGSQTSSTSVVEDSKVGSATSLETAMASSSASAASIVGLSSQTSSPTAQATNAGNEGPSRSALSSSSASSIGISSKTTQLSATGISTTQKLGGQAGGASQTTSTPAATSHTGQGSRMTNTEEWKQAMAILLVLILGIML